MGKLRLLEVSGAPYEMGYQHGSAYARDICALTKDRVALCSDPYWSGSALSREEVLALAEACLEEHQIYSPELTQELRGIADAVGIAPAEVLIMSGFTDFVDLLTCAGQGAIGQRPTYAIDDCTAFMLSARATTDGRGYIGQTWDMHDSATPYVILLRGKPDHAPHFLTFTVTGCVGMIGMNDAGICVGINNLMGNDGQVGVSWVFVVRKALAQTNIEDALECIVSAKLAGAHNYLLFDKHGRGYNIERMASRLHISELDGDCIVHTNHCLHSATRSVERPRPPDSQASSETRIARADALLRKRPLDLDDLMDLLGDEKAICVTAKPPAHIETCGAAIMRPATGEFWAVRGSPASNQFERFVI